MNTRPPTDWAFLQLKDTYHFKNSEEIEKNQVEL
jgi:hypothetical protein